MSRPHTETPSYFRLELDLLLGIAITRGSVRKPRKRLGPEQEVSTMSPALTNLPGEVPVDADAQATVTDFLDYTEYLPSDLTRSLTLVGKLDESYLSFANFVHEQTKTYGSLPSIIPAERPDSQLLRQQISQDLDYALGTREASNAEASRLYDVVDRHYNRLTSIISKLHALPKPPSRDPTPIPQPSSPQTIRKADGTPPPRVHLRLEGPRPQNTSGRVPGSVQKHRFRQKKLIIPGEVLPPPNPDSPPPMTDSEWDSPPLSPIVAPTSRVGAPSRSRSIKPGHPKAPKPPRSHRPKVPKPPRAPRPPGAMGTNVHSAVAGISTSNALSLLTPPPEVIILGSKHAPWMRLTEWEMAKLRKRMKKNAIWTPSETMIRRELSEQGRGPDNYRAAKAKAAAIGEEFIDEDNIAGKLPGQPLVPGELSSEGIGLEDTSLSNRGMKLNEAKKLKREMVQREQAAQAAAELEQEAKRMGDLPNAIKKLFDQPPQRLSQIGAAPSHRASGTGEKPKARAKPKEKDRPQEHAKAMIKPPEKEKAVEKQVVAAEQVAIVDPVSAIEQTAVMEQAIVTEPKPPTPLEIEAQKASLKKRKREATPKDNDPPQAHELVPSPVKSPAKKRRASPEPVVAPIKVNDMITTTTSVPLAAAGPVMVQDPIPSVDAPPSTTTRRSRRQSLVLKAPTPVPEVVPVMTPPRPASRAASRRPSTAPASEPANRDHLKRKSATPAPVPLATAASRRSKRPAPGPVTPSLEGGAALSVGRRQNAPRKRGSGAAATAKKAAEGAANAKAKEEAVKLEEEAAGEEIDPDEPRYCVCGDVSYGTMICCENNDVSSISELVKPRVSMSGDHR